MNNMNYTTLAKPIYTTSITRKFFALAFFFGAVVVAPCAYIVVTVSTWAHTLNEGF